VNFLQLLLLLRLADIATAMTNRVRSTDGFTEIIGTTTREDVVVKVTWYWLTHMVAMVVLSLAFFATAVVFTSEKSRVVWKSSSLAFLMHGLADFDHAQLEHESLHDMSKAAKGLWARLDTDDQGSLKLVKC
jgi:biopolymer transport protein ExbB/TolQ